ncbi:uncharacterized protein LOC113980372, partial [Neopelma chrysocephalum]|uniref:uncharacterized protein LOC113980372 n=1 Tax=Neopelma chrysocephalum TaxID=114329 RepID=UPI000FCCED03
DDCEKLAAFLESAFHKHRSPLLGTEPPAPPEPRSAKRREFHPGTSGRSRVLPERRPREVWGPRAAPAAAPSRRDLREEPPERIRFPSGNDRLFPSQSCFSPRFASRWNLPRRGERRGLGKLPGRLPRLCHTPLPIPNFRWFEVSAVLGSLGVSWEGAREAIPEIPIPWISWNLRRTLVVPLRGSKIPRPPRGGGKAPDASSCPFSCGVVECRSLARGNGNCCPHPPSAALGRGVCSGKSAKEELFVSRSPVGLWGQCSVPGKTGLGILLCAVPGKTSSGILLCAVPGKTSSGILLCAVPVLLLLLLLCRRNPALESCSVLCQGKPALESCSVLCQCCSSAPAVPGENSLWHVLCSVPAFCAGAAPAVPGESRLWHRAGSDASVPCCCSLLVLPHLPVPCHGGQWLCHPALCHCPGASAAPAAPAVPRETGSCNWKLAA